MWFTFGSRKKGQPDPREAEIQAVKRETIEKIESATNDAKTLNDKIEKEGGITELIFLATGGKGRK